MTTPDMRVKDGEGRILFAGGSDDRPTNRVEDMDRANNFVRAARPYGCSIKYPEET